METVQLVVSAAVGLVAGAIVALKYFAPKTKNTTDDAILARLEALEAFIEKLLPVIGVEPPKGPNPPSSGKPDEA